MRGKGARAVIPKEIEALVEHYVSNQGLIDGFLKQVLVHLGQSHKLKELIHTTKSRLKDPGHLRDKLLRKWREAETNQQVFDITSQNLFTKINDLAGIRLLHLHTTQIVPIDKEIRSIIDEQKFDLIEGPFARTWDDEYRDFFEANGIKPVFGPCSHQRVGIPI